MMTLRFQSSLAAWKEVMPFAVFDVKAGLLLGATTTSTKPASVGFSTPCWMAARQMEESSRNSVLEVAHTEHVGLPLPVALGAHVVLSAAALPEYWRALGLLKSVLPARLGHGHPTLEQRTSVQVSTAQFLKTGAGRRRKEV